MNKKGIIWRGGLAFLSVWVMIAEVFIKAPMSKQNRPGWGPSINSTLGWIIMETPSLLGFMYAFYFRKTSQASLTTLILCGLWFFHYFHRSLIYPFTHQGVAKQLNVLIMLSGSCYTGLAGYSFGLLALDRKYDDQYLLLPSFWIGVVLFISGWYFNRNSDDILFHLKSQGKGYQIPRGGLFEYVSCANYTGELLMWLGWTVTTWDLLAFLWLVNCTCNIGTRAINNHKWYIEKFRGDYPKNRKAFIPFIL